MDSKRVNQDNPIGNGSNIKHASLSAILENPSSLAFPKVAPPVCVQFMIGSA